MPVTKNTPREGEAVPSELLVFASPASRHICLLEQDIPDLVLYYEKASAVWQAGLFCHSGSTSCDPSAAITGAGLGFLDHPSLGRDKRKAGRKLKTFAGTKILLSTVTEMMV